jgi:hypothetical protein
MNKKEVSLEFLDIKNKLENIARLMFDQDKNNQAEIGYLIGKLHCNCHYLSLIYDDRDRESEL